MLLKSNINVFVFCVFFFQLFKKQFSQLKLNWKKCISEIINKSFIWQFFITYIRNVWFLFVVKTFNRLQDILWKSDNPVPIATVSRTINTNIWPTFYQKSCIVFQLFFATKSKCVSSLLMKNHSHKIQSKVDKSANLLFLWNFLKIDFAFSTLKACVCYFLLYSPNNSLSKTTKNPYFT